MATLTRQGAGYHQNKPSLQLDHRHAEILGQLLHLPNQLLLPLIATACSMTRLLVCRYLREQILKSMLRVRTSGCALPQHFPQVNIFTRPPMHVCHTDEFKEQLVTSVVQVLCQKAEVG